MEETVRRSNTRLVRTQEDRRDRTEKEQCSKKRNVQEMSTVAERCDFVLRMKKIQRIESGRERAREKSGPIVVRLEKGSLREGHGGCRKDRHTPDRVGPRG